MNPLYLGRIGHTSPFVVDNVVPDVVLRAESSVGPPLPLHFYRNCLTFLCRSDREKKNQMTSNHIDLPQGTLDLLILRTVALGPQHGWAISERVQQMSSDVLRIQQGSLYPALHRLERRGWIKAEWGTSENNRRAKYYELTKSGQKQLEVEKDAWEKLTAAVGQVLRAV
jgi:PadR family transcriptional regulator, regulatory protein PadR